MNDDGVTGPTRHDKMGDVMQRKDACNIFLVTDRKLNQAFIKDLSAQGAFVLPKKVEEVELEREGSGEPLVGESPAQPRSGESKESRDGDAWGKGEHVPPCGDPRLHNSWCNGQEPPPSGTATRDFIRDNLPDLLRLSKTLERRERGGWW